MDHPFNTPKSWQMITRRALLVLTVFLSLRSDYDLLGGKLQESHQHMRRIRQGQAMLRQPV